MSGANYLFEVQRTRELHAQLSESSTSFMLVLSSIQSCYREFPNLNSEDSGEEEPKTDKKYLNDEIQVTQIRSQCQHSHTKKHHH